MSEPAIHILRVVPLKLEATRFLVESENGMDCDRCGKECSNASRRVRLAPGDECPRRGCGGCVDHKWYLVDLSFYGGLGKCSCKAWDCQVWPRVKALTPAQWIAVRHWHGYRCKHLEVAVRFYAMLRLDEARAQAGDRSPRNREMAGA